MIDLRRVHVLRMVHELGTVTAAGEALHLTPSAVSQQLRQLGRDTQVALLERDGRRVRLTPAAHALLRHADAMAARWEEAKAELAAGVPLPELRLAGFSSSVTTFLVPAARWLQGDSPDLPVRVLQVEAVDAYPRLLACEVDVAVVLPGPESPPRDDPRFEQEALLDEPLDLLVPAAHRLAGGGAVALEHAAQDPWVVPEPGSCDHHTITAAACAAAGFAPRVAHEAMDWTGVATLVAAGMGVCLKPRHVRIPTELEVVAVPLAPPAAPHRRILTCVRRGSAGQPHVAAGLAALRHARDTILAGAVPTPARPAAVTAVPA